MRTFAITMALILLIGSTAQAAVQATWSYEGDVYPTAATPAWTDSVQPYYALDTDGSTTLLNMDYSRAGTGYLWADSILGTNSIGGVHTMEVRFRVNERSVGGFGLEMRNWRAYDPDATWGFFLAGTDITLKLGSGDHVITLGDDWWDGDYHTIRLCLDPHVGTSNDGEWWLYFDGAQEYYANGVVGNYRTSDVLRTGGVGNTGGNWDYDYIRVVEGQLVHTEAIIPEPVTLTLLGLGGLAVLLRRRR